MSRVSGAVANLLARRVIVCRRFSTALDIPSTNSVKDDFENCPLEDTKHRITAASILIRQPITLRKLTEFETAYEAYRLSLQAEYARGEFHIATKHDNEFEEKEEEGKEENSKSNGLQESSEEFSQSISENHQLPEIYVKADGDVRSLMRRLDSKLYFVIKDEWDQWRFPKVVRKMLEGLLGGECDLYHMGYAPVAYLYEPLPDRTLPPYGQKSQLIGGHLCFTPGLTARSFAWLTRDELKKVMEPHYYNKVVATLQP